MCRLFDDAGYSLHSAGMRLMLSLLLVTVLLLGSPLAHAVDCVMTRTQTPEALAGMPADCPMVAAALAGAASEAPQLSVADCVKSPGLAPTETAAPTAQHLPGAVLPLAGIALAIRASEDPLPFKPPPRAVSSRRVLLATARLRP